MVGFFIMVYWNMQVLSMMKKRAITLNFNSSCSYMRRSFVCAFARLAIAK